MALITSENPKTVSKTYSNWWLLEIKGITTNANQANQSFGMQFVFVRGNRKEDGTWELSPFREDIKGLNVEDVFALAASEAANGNMQVAQALEAIVTLSSTLAKNAGVID
jgi:hypothetical protein